MWIVTFVIVRCGRLVPDQPATRLIAEGELTPQKLIEPRTAPHGTVQYLRYVEQLTPLEAAKFLARHQRKFHRSRGRLARVGLASRIVDALFSITLFLRGRVPGGTAAAAAAIYEEAQAEKEEYVYYARLVRQNGYICLHYFYFYAMNDWRSKLLWRQRSRIGLGTSDRLSHRRLHTAMGGIRLARFLR